MNFSVTGTFPSMTMTQMWQDCFPLMASGELEFAYIPEPETGRYEHPFGFRETPRAPQTRTQVAFYADMQMHVAETVRTNPQRAVLPPRNTRTERGRHLSRAIRGNRTTLFAKLLQKLMDDHDLTQLQFTAQTGIRQATISLTLLQGYATDRLLARMAPVFSAEELEQLDQVNFNTNFGRYLYELIHTFDLSLEDLSSRTGLSKSAIIKALKTGKAKDHFLRRLKRVFIAEEIEELEARRIKDKKPVRRPHAVSKIHNPLAKYFDELMQRHGYTSYVEIAEKIPRTREGIRRALIEGRFSTAMLRLFLEHHIFTPKEVAKLQSLNRSRKTGGPRPIGKRKKPPHTSPFALAFFALMKEKGFETFSQAAIAIGISLPTLSIALGNGYATNYFYRKMTASGIFTQQEIDTLKQTHTVQK